MSFLRLIICLIFISSSSLLFARVNYCIKFESVNHTKSMKLEKALCQVSHDWTVETKGLVLRCIFGEERGEAVTIEDTLLSIEKQNDQKVYLAELEISSATPVGDALFSHLKMPYTEETQILNVTLPSFSYQPYTQSLLFYTGEDGDTYELNVLELFYGSCGFERLLKVSL